jgi:sarcosine oxidase subunit gamma
MLDLSRARVSSVPNAIPTANVSLTAAPSASRFVLRGVDAVTAVGVAFGVAIPDKPLTSATSGDRGALWLGPDEWLLLAPEAETAALYRQLTTALDGIACALVDVSHRQIALLLEGPKATAILNAGVPLDLSLAAFPVGMVTRTIFEKAEIVLWRTGPQAFHLEVWRSFAPYVLALLQAADRDAL